MASPQKIRVRYAPSPTGKLHIGNVHTFLFNYCFAKHGGGEVLLRIEDTDLERSKPEFTDNIKDSLTWLGLNWDGEPVFQSQRQTNYLSYTNQLLESGDAYYCYHTQEELERMRKEQEDRGEAPRYDGSCRNLTPEQIKRYQAEGRKPSIRFRMTGADRPTEIKYSDMVYGEISYNPDTIGDFVIVRSDDSILYNFGNVIDDHEMNITHIIRGQSHLTNTPRQILLYQALGWDVPEFGHLPEILNPDRVGKLSKRYGAVSVTDFRDQGYLSEAVVNFLGSLGWSHPEGKEFFDLAEMVRIFSFDRVSKAPAALDLDKLDFLNAHYLRQQNDDEFAALLQQAFTTNETKLLGQLVPLLKDRVANLSDIKKYAGYFFEEPSKPKFKFADYRKVLSLAAQTLDKVSDWNKEEIETKLRLAQQESGIGAKDFFVTIGQAISGQDVFLPLFDSLEILGQEITLQRLRRP